MHFEIFEDLEIICQTFILIQKLCILIGNVWDGGGGGVPAHQNLLRSTVFK